MYKRLCAALATATIAASALAGCSSDVEPTQDTNAAEKPTVLTTFTVLADIAENIAGEHLNVESITKPGAEIHDYEPTPGDVAKASEADLILDNGLNLETWFKQFVQEADVPHAVVTEGIEPIDIASDAYAGKPNPHAWMSPKNVQVYADNMAKAFAELDPEHATDYQANADAYKDKLQQVQDTMVGEIQKVPEQQRALVTCEGAFSYLTRDAGLEEQYIWPVNAEQQATPQKIASVIEYVKENKVPAVFCESTVTDKPMQQVVDATGTTFGGTLYVDSLSEEGGPVPTYLDLITHDAETITKGLTGTADK